MYDPGSTFGYTFEKIFFRLAFYFGLHLAIMALGLFFAFQPPVLYAEYLG